jgi:hypothetical protein
MKIFKRTFKTSTVVTVSIVVILASVSFYLYRQYLASDIRIESTVSVPFDTHHVQGLVVTDRYYFISAVDVSAKRGWIYKVQRSKKMKLAQSKDITDGKRYHPGGMDFDGKYLWVCLSEYKAHSTADIIALDPDSLAVRASFRVKDHISFIVSDGNGRLFGSNWASKMLYEFDRAGHVIKYQPNTLRKRDYQDGSFVNGKIVVGCKRTGRIDILDPDTFERIGGFRTPHMSIKDTMTREGFCVYDNRFFLMPEDGVTTRIMTCTVRGGEILFGEKESLE